MTVRCSCFDETNIDSSICAAEAFPSARMLALNLSKADCVAVLFSGVETK